MPSKKEKWQVWPHVLILLSVAVLLVAVCSRNAKHADEKAVPLTFIGEYNIGGTWKPLTAGTGFSAYDGDLILRGSFSEEIPEGQMLYLYLDHIACNVLLNDVQLMCSSAWEYSAVTGNCGTSWLEVPSPGITGEDVVQIHLHNSHRLGNAEAYNELLDSLRIASADALRTSLVEENLLLHAVGIAILILALGILGIAFAFSLMRRASAPRIWFMGLLSLFFAAYVLLDKNDVSLWSYSTVFNTYAKNLCFQMMVLELNILAADHLTGQVRRMGNIMLCIAGGLTVTVLAACFTGQILIFDTLVFLIPAQMLLCIAVLALCVAEWIKLGKGVSGTMLACMLLLCAVAAEGVNEYGSFWPNQFVLKVVFIAAFTLRLIAAIKLVPESYRRAEQAERLEDDLKNSRIVLAMSQIRTHFIFNILNAISGMCKYDAKKADETVVRFARYLRSNIDIMEQDEPEWFETSLRHLEDYIALEQVRFGDKIRFISDVSVSDFKLPPLVLQPIVENAIKHGLMPKANGGTIVLHTWQEERNIFISVQDDGVGFRLNQLEKTDGNKSVGLNNVRFRLENTVHGGMEIESYPRKGTTVTIWLPREEEK